MTPLKEQTVYIPTGHKSWKGKFSVHIDDNSHAQFANESKQICLSKEQLITILQQFKSSTDNLLMPAEQYVNSIIIT